MLEVKFPFIKGLSYKLNTGFTYQNSSYKNYQGLDTYEGASANGVLNTDDWHSEEWILENIISYQREFGKHRIFSQDYILLKARNMNRIQWKVRIFPMM